MMPPNKENAMGIPLVPEVKVVESGSGNTCFFCPRERIVYVDASQTYRQTEASRPFCRRQAEKDQNTRTWEAFDSTVQNYGASLGKLVEEEIPGRTLEDVKRKGSRLKPRHFESILQKASAPTPKGERDSDDGHSRTTASRITEMKIEIEPDGKRKGLFKRSIASKGIRVEDVKDVTRSGTLSKELVGVFGATMVQR